MVGRGKLVADIREDPRLLPKSEAILPAATGRVSAAALNIPPTATVGAGLVMTLVCRVTVPVRVDSLASKVAPAFSVIDSSASVLPLNAELDPKVAEVPTCQKTLKARAPPARMTSRP